MSRLIFMVFLLIMYSCQKDLRISLPETEPKYVVSCLFSSDSIFRLRLSTTRGLNDTSEMIVPDANCMLSFGNTYDTLFYEEDGIYTSNIVAERGLGYNLIVETSDGVRLTAYSYVPDNLDIIGLKQKDFAIEDNRGSSDGSLVLPFCSVSVNIKDDPDEENFYEVKLLLKLFFNDSVTNTVYQVPIYSYDPVVKNEEILDYSPAILPFSDKLFNGQTKTIDFLYHPPWLNRSSDGEHNTYSYGSYRVIVVFREISKQMYYYRKSMIKHLYNQQTDNFEVLGDPVQLWSNIANGYGIFAGYTQYVDTIYVEESFITY